jgi:hypothetical protein
MLIHMFGDGTRAGTWGEGTATLHEHLRPTADDLVRIASAARGPVTLVAAGRISPETLAGVTSDADVTIVVADPAAGVAGRGSGDLAGALWQTDPAVATLLGDSPLDAGAVVFSAGAVKRLGGAAPAGDPVTAAVATVVGGGGTLRAVLVPAHGSDSSLPVDPPPLGPSKPTRPKWVAETIDRLEPARLLGKVGSRSDAAAVKAGLLLWHDFLDASHEVSQSIEGQGRHRAGDYWHAIMHRREADYGNAKYWFHRVGRHPVFESLATRAERFAAEADTAGSRLLSRITSGGSWNPDAFVDACAESARGGSPGTDLLLRGLQADEMLLLLWQTCRDARG